MSPQPEKAPLSAAIVMCLSPVLLAGACIVIDLVPNYKGEFVLTFLSLAIAPLLIAFSALCCALVFLSARPDSSNAILHFVQVVLREVVESEVYRKSKPSEDPLRVESKKSADELAAEASLKREEVDIAFKVRLTAGKKLTTLRELQKWFREERTRIFDDDSLTAEEQDEQYLQLRESFNEKKKQLREHVGVYEED